MFCDRLFLLQDSQIKDINGLTCCSAAWQHKHLEAFDLTGYSVGSIAGTMNPTIPYCLVLLHEFGARKVGEEKQLQLQASCLILSCVHQLQQECFRRDRSVTTIILAINENGINLFTNYI